MADPLKTAANQPPIGRRFDKGVSGNPGGRPKGIAALAREHKDKALDVLVALYPLSWHVFMQGPSNGLFNMAIGPFRFLVNYGQPGFGA